jgi:glycosyltransferase involved in cell wall biosynthesis
VPHGLNENIFKPIDDTNPTMIDFKKSIFNGEERDFVLFFNSRNIRRKQIPDTLLAFKYFLDQLPKEKADKCSFILHTEVISEHGTDLEAIRKILFKDYPNAILFSQEKLHAEQLNLLYNLADAQILLTSNEGWGLSLTEAILAGTPIIANVTGGMQDQMRFVDENGDWYINSSKVPSNHTGKYKKHGKWAFPVYPTNRSIQGSPTTPYIWDDRCRPEDASNQIMELYSMTREERKTLGLEGREWAIGEAGFTGKIMGERIIKSIDQLFNTWIPREKFEFIDIDDVKEPQLNHELLY